MVVGEISYKGDFLLTFSLFDGNGDLHDIPAILDTGFQGVIALPLFLIDELKLPLSHERPVELADGTSLTVEVYRVRIVWDGEERNLQCYAMGDFPIIGMRLLQGYDVHFHVVDGGIGTIFRLP